MSASLLKSGFRQSGFFSCRMHLLFLAALCTVSLFNKAHAQSNLAGWNLNNTLVPTSASVVTGVTASNFSYGSNVKGGVPFLNTFFSVNFTGFFLTTKNWTQSTTPNNDRYLEFTVTPGANNIMRIKSVSFEATNALGLGPRELILKSSYDNYTSTLSSITSFSQTFINLTNFTLPPPVSMTLSSPISTTGAVTFKIFGYKSGSSNSDVALLNIDNLKVNGTLISVSSSSLSGLNATCSTASTAQSFTLAATNATGAVSLNAPAGFEVALRSGGSCPTTGYASTTTVSPTSGTINQAVCVRRQSGLTPGSVTSAAQLTISGGEVATVTVGLSGSTTAASTVSITSSTACQGQGQSLTLAAVPSSAGSYTYSWSPSPSAGQSTSLVTITTANTYSVLITDANGCTNTASASASFTPLPNPSFTGLPASYCFGAAPLLLTPATPGGSFSVSGLGSISGNNYVPPGSGAPGPATITYSVTTSGCSNTASASISLGDQLPTITNLLASSPVGNGTCSVKLTATGTGPKFTFTGPNGYTFTNVYRSAGTYNVSAMDVKDPGTYTLTIDNGSCQTSAQVDVTGTACPE